MCRHARSQRATPVNFAYVNEKIALHGIRDRNAALAILAKSGSLLVLILCEAEFSTKQNSAIFAPGIHGADRLSLKVLESLRGLQLGTFSGRSSEFGGYTSYGSYAGVGIPV